MTLKFLHCIAKCIIEKRVFNIFPGPKWTTAKAIRVGDVQNQTGPRGQNIEISCSVYILQAISGRQGQFFKIKKVNGI